MGNIIIEGGHKLKGDIVIEGSKNAALPILSAAVLNEGKSVIKNCPMLYDVKYVLDILSEIGCKVKIEKNTVTIDSSTIHSTEIPEKLATKMRSSIIFLGPMISRFKKVTISYPGGCEIGPRPIDLHIKALKKMGINFEEIKHGYIYCDVDKLKGADIYLDYPSVGATENIMLAATFAEGTTYIRNAAKEPEIMDLQNFMSRMGVQISGAGTSVIKIEGSNKKLKSIEHTVISDRIVTGTYLIAACVTGGELVLKNVVPEHLGAVISVLRDAGCFINVKRNTLKVSGIARSHAIEIVRTLPYPGFPTDMQAQLMSLLAISKGTSMIIETVFENRYRHVEELTKMGANIRLEGRLAVIKGVEKLTGANVAAKDLRGGAALILSGLAADGETIVEDVKHIYRGYEDINTKLANVGAVIKTV